MWYSVSFTLNSQRPKPRDGINLIKRLPHSTGQKLTQPRKPFTLVVPKACHLLGDTRPYLVDNINHRTLNLGFVFFASVPTLWNGCSYSLKWHSGSHPPRMPPPVTMPNYVHHFITRAQRSWPEKPLINILALSYFVSISPWKQSVGAIFGICSIKNPPLIFSDVFTHSSINI